MYYSKFKTSPPIVKNKTNSSQTFLIQTNVVYNIYAHFKSVS